MQRVGGTGWLSWVSSSSYLDFLIRELFLSTEPRVTSTFAKSCVKAKCQNQTFNTGPWRSWRELKYYVLLPVQTRAGWEQRSGII